MNAATHAQELFGTGKAMVGMVHVQALPGTPLAARPMPAIVERAVEEAQALAAAGFDALIIENMHDRPYLAEGVGPEIVAGMTAVLAAVRSAVEIPVGVQILAGANCEALAVAAAAGGAFIRAENFIFAHVADEGLTPAADAGRLLRYRRAIGAEHIRVLADVKKKHASHALTADISIAEAAQAAEFFGADGVIVTGMVTGEPASLSDVRDVSAAVELPVLIGSGVTPGNLPELWEPADAFIVGSFLKLGGRWDQPLDPDRIALLADAVQRLREADGSAAQS